jgi:hypothetical protein
LIWAVWFARIVSITVAFKRQKQEWMWVQDSLRVPGTSGFRAGRTKKISEIGAGHTDRMIVPKWVEHSERAQST